MQNKKTVKLIENKVISIYGGIFGRLMMVWAFSLINRLEITYKEGNKTITYVITNLDMSNISNSQKGNK